MYLRTIEKSLLCALQTTYPVHHHNKRQHNIKYLFSVAISAFLCLFSFSACSAMASSSTTLQVEALSTVHLNFADIDKNDLKEKLAQKARSLEMYKSSGKMMKMIKDQQLKNREDRIKKLIENEKQYKRFAAKGCKNLHAVQKKLKEGKDTGLSLSPNEVQKLLLNLEKAETMMWLVTGTDNWVNCIREGIRDSSSSSGSSSSSE